jgi:hypothetical protein
MTLSLTPGGGFLDRLADPAGAAGLADGRGHRQAAAASFRAEGARGPFNWYRNIDLQLEP